VLVIVAGSNGCGKTSMTTLARTKFQQFPILDPDAMARSLQEASTKKTSDIEVGKQVLRQAEDLISAQQSFTVETTLSGSTYLKMAARARVAGFNVVVFFVGTNSVEINLERVRNRVCKGGHDVPEADQRRRYPRTLANMRKLLPLADLAFLFDNSTEQGHVLVGLCSVKALSWIAPVPAWVNMVRVI